MNREELFKKVKEIETEKSKLYFINTLPVNVNILDRVIYLKKLVLNLI